LLLLALRYLASPLLASRYLAMPLLASRYLLLLYFLDFRP